jgi:hypothetical protein
MKKNIHSIARWKLPTIRFAALQLRRLLPALYGQSYERLARFGIADMMGPEPVGDYAIIPSDEKCVPEPLPQSTHRERHQGSGEVHEGGTDAHQRHAEAVMNQTPRNIVLMAIASHCIGFVVFASDGELSKELVAGLVLKGVEV